MKRSYSDYCITQSTQADSCRSNAVARRARGIRHLSDEELSQHGKEDITDNNGDGQSDGSHTAVQRWLSIIRPGTAAERRTSLVAEKELPIVLFQIRP
ncbi:hypothetical protein IF2G_11065 [Cordyceps javanica]|nr:hypothetical protein IF2G_11065 [Cordyceps javanica]